MINQVSEALLLAAGKGIRLSPFSDLLPKCMMPIHGRPLLEIWLENLTQAGIKKFFINVSSKAEWVEEYLKATTFWPQITLLKEEKLRGTAGTMAYYAKYFSNDHLLVIHADNLSSFSIKDFIGAHMQKASGIEITMMTFVTDNPQSCGIVEQKNNIVIGFHEKQLNPPGNLANGAVFIVSKKVVAHTEDLVKTSQIAEDFSKEVIPLYLGKIQTWLNDCYHRDIGNPISYLAAQDEAISRMLPKANPKNVKVWSLFCQKHDLENKLKCLCQKYCLEHKIEPPQKYIICE